MEKKPSGHPGNREGGQFSRRLPERRERCTEVTEDPDYLTDVLLGTFLLRFKLSLKLGTFSQEGLHGSTPLVLYWLLGISVPINVS
jgi:hypothetical protein